jgi:hypothetical protein
LRCHVSQIPIKTRTKDFSEKLFFDIRQENAKKCRRQRDENMR